MGASPSTGRMWTEDLGRSNLSTSDDFRQMVALTGASPSQTSPPRSHPNGSFVMYLAM